MQELYELRNTLCKELKKYGSKNDISSGNLDIIDKLAHAVKNIDKILDEDGGFSYGHMDGVSYARGRGTNAKRDSMGRYSREPGYSRDGGYSRDHELAAELKGLMNEAHDESVRQDIQRVITKIESM